MHRNIFACKLTKNCELSNICKTNDCKFALKYAPKSPSIYIKKKAEKEDFVPNFVNPFREKQPGFAPADIKDHSKD